MAIFKQQLLHLLKACLINRLHSTGEAGLCGEGEQVFLAFFFFGFGFKDLEEGDVPPHISHCETKHHVPLPPRELATEGKDRTFFLMKIQERQVDCHFTGRNFLFLSWSDASAHSRAKGISDLLGLTFIALLMMYTSL